MTLEKVEYRDGPYRPYKLIKRRFCAPLTRTDWAILLFLTSCSLLRIYKLYQPDKVIFDELHTWRQIQHYREGKFFLDVHPPLAKLIYYFFDHLAGSSSSTFQRIGQSYVAQLYVAMRLFAGVCAVMSVDLVYLLMRLDSGYMTSVFTSLLLCLDNSHVVQSRLILADAPLLVSQIAAIYFLKSAMKREFFTKSWWLSLFATGVSLGFTMSLKLNGWFTFVWVGVVTCWELYDILGDLTIPILQWLKHVLWRFAAVVVVPLTIYCSVWYLHFELLPYESSHSGYISPHFRSTFRDYEPDPVEVLYGSTITLKHNNLEKYLHSHNAHYPEGSNLQQVTLYDFANDVNNEWVVETPHKYYEQNIMHKVKPVKDGDTIRLYHKRTGHYLHVNDIRPPVSDRYDYANEVNCNETRGLLGNTEYEFKVRIVGKKKHAVNDLPLIKLRATETVMQLVHRNQKCILVGHEARLPLWGNEQNEVLCVEEPTIPNSLWYVEANSHPILEQMGDAIPKVKFDAAPFRFWHKMWEIHQAMIRLNAGFTTINEASSSALSWPLSLSGTPYFESEATLENDAAQIYYLGNVAVYWTTFAALLISMVKLFLHLIRNMNPLVLYVDTLAKSQFYDNSSVYLLGWLLHFIPYVYMERNLYLHHYLPALVFAILNLGEYVQYQNNKYIRAGLVCAITGAVAYCFMSFIPLVYGSGWTVSECEAHRWFPGWNFNCEIYTGQ
ncbi:uncharacterized protein LODBEIA_P19140 [Lodderomyces beijingensis]|uniref:Dolichyl-phosphate-mannose--protein mannosyltransferase n=1 Tax=Lodderomyces beijingensis TaxID=1775926 RepID=A0ABP0ZHS0_9ASCO